MLDVAFYSEHVPKGHIRRRELATQGRDHERLRGVQDLSRPKLAALCGTFPGYWFTVFFIDIVSRFAIQLDGFIFMTAFMFGLAIPYHHWTTTKNHVGLSSCTPSPSSPTSGQLHNLHHAGRDLPNT
jgi:PHS family inorganic phosphate transporter-like MFS transporter